MHIQTHTYVRTHVCNDYYVSTFCWALSLSLSPSSSSSTSTTVRFIVVLCSMGTLAWQLYSILAETHFQWLDACLLDKIYSIKPHVNAVPQCISAHFNSCFFIYTYARNTFMKRSTSALHRYPIHMHACMHTRMVNILFCFMADTLATLIIPFSLRMCVSNTLNKSNNWIKNSTWNTINSDICIRLLPFNSKCYTFLGSTVHKSFVSLTLLRSFSFLHMIIFPFCHSFFFYIWNQIVASNVANECLEPFIIFTFYICDRTGSVYVFSRVFECVRLINLPTALHIRIWF